MKRTCALLCLLFLSFPRVSPPAESTKPRPLALAHVTVIDVTGAPPNPDVTVLIRGDRIVGNAACSHREADLLKSWQDALAKFLASGHADDPLWSIPGFRRRIRLALDTYDPKMADALFALLRANHTWLCPT